jgi:cytochrome P450
MVRDPANTLVGLQHRYGNVFRFGAGPLAYTCLLGPDANRYLLSEHPENFTWREALKALIVVDGDTALVVSDGIEHQRRRRLVQPAFATRAINGYMDVMVNEANRTIDTWSAGQEVDAYAECRRAIRRIAMRTLFGETLGDRDEEFADSLSAALDFVNKPMPVMVKLPLPGTGWTRAKQGRDRADEIVNAEIARRRAAAPADEDLLDRLLNATDDEGGSALSDVEVRDQVVSLIAAGYDTTSAAAGWTLHELLHNEGEWERAAAEVQDVVGDERLTMAHLAAMPHLDRVVNESLRLWPPGFISARHATGDFEFDGHIIKAGSMVVYSAYVTHRMPDVWPEPERFKPDRWIDLDVDPYAFVPFGGGYRRCIGFAFATQELKVLLAEILRRVEMTGLRPTVERTGVASVSPRGGVPIRIRSVTVGDAAHRSPRWRV